MRVSFQGKVVSKRFMGKPFRHLPVGFELIFQWFQSEFNRLNVAKTVMISMGILMAVVRMRPGWREF